MFLEERLEALSLPRPVVANYDDKVSVVASVDPDYSLGGMQHLEKVSRTVGARKEHDREIQIELGRIKVESFADPIALAWILVSGRRATLARQAQLQRIAQPSVTDHEAVMFKPRDDTGAVQPLSRRCRG
jgi:hypothetical protein